MKKIISMALALTMVFSAFTALVKADSLPTVSVTTTKVTDAEEAGAIVETLVDNGDIESEDDLDGYSLYKIEASVEGLALSRTGDTKINGTMLTGFELIANGDMSKVLLSYVNETASPWVTFTIGSTGFSLGWDATKFKAAKSFPAKSQTLDTTVPTLFYTAYLYVEDGATYTVAGASMATDVYSGGNSTGDPTAYDTVNYPSSIAFGEEEETTYTYTFKDSDGTLIGTVGPLTAGATVTAPTAPTKVGVTFDHWSDEANGSAVDVDATASDNKTYFAVYVSSAPAYETITVDTTEQAAKVVDGTEKTYTDYDNNPVPVTKGYAIARFKTDISSAKEYKLHCEAPGEEAKDKPMNFGGIEISGIANFVVILKGAPAGATMEIRATDK